MIRFSLFLFQIKPIGLNFFEDSLYWKGESTGTLRKRQLFGDKTYSIISIGNNNINGLFVLSQISRQPISNGESFEVKNFLPAWANIYIAHFSTQISETNRCKTFGCAHICIHRNSEPVCICADGQLWGAKKECPIDENNEFEELHNRARDHHEDVDDPTLSHVEPPMYMGTRTYTAVAVIFVAFILLGAVYFFLKKQKPELFSGRDLRSKYFLLI